MFQCLRNNNMGVVPVMETVVSLPKFAFDATAFNSPKDSLPEPLCAIYEPHLLSKVLDNSKLLPSNSPRDLLLQSRVKTIKTQNPTALENTNYPREDLSEIES